MRRFATLGLGVVLGVCLTVGAMWTTASLQAQLGPGRVDPGDMAALRRQFESQPPTRLIEIPAPRGQSRVEGVGQNERVIQAPPPMVFLKDVKTDGCWLAFMGNQYGPISLAVAPADACQ